MPDDQARAGFDWRCFARELGKATRATGLPQVHLAAQIGVTASDLSRALGGTNVEVGKVIALCEFMGREVTDFYLRPMKSTRFTAPNVKHDEAARP